MKHPRMARRLGAAGVLVCTAMATGCAQIPKSPVAESEFHALSCEQIARQAEAAAVTKAVADQAKSNSWHAILPMVVVVRYAHAGSAANEAERRQALLSGHSARLGCVL